MLGRALFWTSLGATLVDARRLSARGCGARARPPRPVRKADITPSVTVIVAAHDEETVIERRLENLLELDYPPRAARRSSSPPTPRPTGPTRSSSELAAREPRVRLLRCPRGGKVAAQNLAVRETSGEIVAFSDANATWAPDALRKLVRELRRSRGRLRLRAAQLQSADGTNREGAYWRYEMWLREQESRSAPSPAATARSTRCAAVTTSRSIRASATTSRSRT